MNEVIERYVAIHVGAIIGHALIKAPNIHHLQMWRDALGLNSNEMIELGGAFVDPNLLRNGIWTSLLEHRLEAVYDRGARPVTATWAKNEHVKITLRKYGALDAGRQSTDYGDVDLFVF